MTHDGPAAGRDGSAAGPPREDGGQRRFRAGAPPKGTSAAAKSALTGAVLVVLCSWATLRNLRAALVTLNEAGTLADAVLVLLGIAALWLVIPAWRGQRFSAEAHRALARGDLIEARVASASARTLIWITVGYSAGQVVLLLIVQFFIANDLAVSRTFFLLPQITSSFWLILKAFWINIYIFMTAEVLVLVWALVVAIARLAPGPAGRPLRMLATFYVDIFRSLPAIINVYLIGFGIPLTGLPILKDMSQQSFAILALTLTSGAYVAEVYRAGIESIHWSQTAAARSLGLSYMQTLRYVVIPQGVRHIIPPLLNSFIGLQKDTALVNVIGTIDAFNQSIIIASNNFNLSPVTTVAILFIVITIPQARLVDRLIERDRRRMRVGS
jgi:polar amino acid transport system permease protein